MPFLQQTKKNKVKPINTSPSKTEISAAKEMGIDLAKSWRAYSKEARIHIYVSDMKEMVRFYNQILEFPVVRYWRYSDGDGTMMDIGGNVIELFSKGRRNFSDRSFYGNVSLSIKVDNVCKLYEKFCKKNIKLGELISHEWGDSSFAIVDPEGNRLVFFSPDISKEKYYKVKRG